MKILLIGASGYVGQALIRRLQAEGNSLAALARDEQAGARFSAVGITPVRGDVMTVGVATRGLADFDACIWLSWLEWSVEAKAIRALLGSIDPSAGHENRHFHVRNGDARYPGADGALGRALFR